jgi:putative transposase
MLIVNEQHLKRVLAVFVNHYNGHRPHRALALRSAPRARPAIAVGVLPDAFEVHRRDHLGGVVHEYGLAA